MEIINSKSLSDVRPLARQQRCSQYEAKDRSYPGLPNPNFQKNYLSKSYQYQYKSYTFNDRSAAFKYAPNVLILEKNLYISILF